MSAEEQEQYTIALYVNEGFISRYDTSFFLHNQATGLMTKFSDNNAYITVLISNPKITFIHADESISLTCINNQIEKLGECAKFIIYRNTQSLDKAKNTLGEMFFSLKKISLPKTCQELYIGFSASLFTLAAQTPEILNLNFKNCRALGCRLSVSQLTDVICLKSPEDYLIETHHALHRGLLPDDKLKRLPYEPVIFDLNSWRSITFKYDPFIEQLLEKTKDLENPYSIITYFIENNIQTFHSMSPTMLAIYIAYYHANFDRKKIFVQLIEGFLQLIVDTPDPSLQLLIKKLREAIKNPEEAFEKVSEIKEVKSFTVSKEEVEKMSCLGFNFTQNHHQKSLQVKSVISYVKSCQLLYQNFRGQDHAPEIQTLSVIAKQREARARLLDSQQQFNDAHESYRFSIGFYQLFFTPSEWILLSANLTLVKSLCRYFYAAPENLNTYLEAKATFDTFMRMKKSLAEDNTELLSLYEFILFLYRHILNKNKIDEIKILEVIIGLFLERESDEPVTIIAGLLYFYLTKTPLDKPSLRKIADTMISLNSEMCKAIWHSFISFFKSFLIDDILEKEVVTDTDILPIKTLKNNLTVLATLATHHPELLFSIQQTERFLLISLITERHFPLFCQISKGLHSKNIILFELHHHIIQIIQLISNNNSVEYFELLKIIIEYYLELQQENHNEQTILCQLWGYLLYVIFAEQSLKLINFNSLMTILKSMTQNTYNIIFASFKDYISNNYEEMDIAIIGILRENAKLLLSLEDKYFHPLAMFLLDIAILLANLTQQEEKALELNQFVFELSCPGIQKKLTTLKRASDDKVVIREADRFLFQQEHQKLIKQSSSENKDVKSHVCSKKQ